MRFQPLQRSCDRPRWADGFALFILHRHLDLERQYGVVLHDQNR